MQLISCIHGVSGSQFCHIEIRARKSQEPVVCWKLIVNCKHYRESMRSKHETKIQHDNFRVQITVQDTQINTALHIVYCVSDVVLIIYDKCSYSSARRLQIIF